LRETFSEITGYYTYALAEWAATHLPESLGRGIFRGLGALAFRFSTGARDVVSANLAQVLGRPADSPIVRAAVRESFDRYAVFWHETFRIRVLDEREFDSRVSSEGVERVHEAIDEGRGAIVVSAHLGNWDVVASWAARLRGFRVMAVTEALRPKRLMDLFTRHREELGISVVTLEDGTEALRKLRKHLEGNGVVAIVADRDLSGKGVKVEMFGRPLQLPAGPAYLSLVTGAPIVCISSVSYGGRWRFRVGEYLRTEPTGDRRADIQALTEAMASELERAISAFPTEWHMFQPAWP